MYENLKGFHEIVAMDVSFHRRC